MATLKRFIRRVQRERGSALLVSLMVMVGLSLLGLAFVAISETEGAISINERNYTQTLQVAEAGANMAVDWFQNPFWARDQGLAPQNVDAIKVIRTIAAETPARYKSGSLQVLFDKPFRPRFIDRFYGTETNPDILINSTTGATAGLGNVDFLTLFNKKLFNNDPAAATLDNGESIRVTEIRVYSPPIDGGTINAQAGWTTAAGIPANVSGFYEGGSRFGIATIKVTAERFNSAGRAIANRSVKMTISEWPFPGPQGPLQSNANINTGGNFQVHWGQMTSEGTMEAAKAWTTVPHMDAYNRAAIEYGYDSKTYTPPLPALPVPAPFPVNPVSPGYDRAAWLLELIGRDFTDPWFEMRARGLITQPVVNPATPHPYKWVNPAVLPDTTPSPAYSSWFHVQNTNLEPDQLEVLFPKIDYNFWKQLAVAADSQPQVYYLQWVVDDVFRDRAGNQRTARQWLDVTTNPPAGTGPKSVSGFYFFDTQNGLNPQLGGGGILTPEVKYTGGSMQMKGFVYLNMDAFGTTGLLGPAADATNNFHYYQQPGEPYRDLGFRQVNEATNTWDVDGLGNFIMIKQANREWDFQDLPQTPGGKNGIFDYLVAPRFPAPARASAPSPIPALSNFFIVPYTPGCTPTVNCSEPHEPYLNLIYPLPNGAVSPTDPTRVGWHSAASALNRRPKIQTAGAPVACVAESGVAGTAAKIADRARCTSNAYDRDGSIMRIDDMILEGVLYNEGQFDAKGNARYFGSILVQGNAEKAGNPDVFFDERLVKGQWPPGNFGFPRVFIAGVSTDN